MKAKAITAPNPYEKGTNGYKLFNALKSGKQVTAGDLFETTGHLSNRTLGVFYREMEKKGFRFTRKKVEGQMVYTMHHGDEAKGIQKISVAPGSYKDKATSNAKGKKKTTKKAVAPAKSAPAKAPAKKAAAPAAKSTVKGKGKPRPQRGDDADDAAAEVKSSVPAKKAKVALKLKAK